MSKKKYTIEQIREYLRGYRLSSGDVELGNNALDLAISLLEDWQDGIEAIIRRNENAKNMSQTHIPTETKDC